MAGKWDKDIERLFQEGLGARQIAKRLGISNHATVSKRLMKLGLKRRIGSNQIPVSTGESEVKFHQEPHRLSKAAQEYFKFLCYLACYDFLTPDEGAPYDLMVDFGDGLKKVQVKSSSHCPTGSYIFEITRTRHNATSSKNKRYQKDEVDYFFLYSIDGRSWLIPHENLKNQNTVAPVDRYPGYEIK